MKVAITSFIILILFFQGSLHKCRCKCIIISDFYKNGKKTGTIIHKGNETYLSGENLSKIHFEYGDKVYIGDSIVYHIIYK